MVDVVGFVFFNLNLCIVRWYKYFINEYFFVVFFLKFFYIEWFNRYKNLKIVILNFFNVIEVMVFFLYINDKYGSIRKNFFFNLWFVILWKNGGNCFIIIKSCIYNLNFIIKY